MNVSAVLVTRGNVDMRPVLDSLPPEWERVICDNRRGRVTMLGSEAIWDPDWSEERVPDLSVYGRYAAIEYASHDVIYVQDDDVIVSDPQEIVQEWIDNSVAAWPVTWGMGAEQKRDDHIVCNMPPEFREHYPDSALVGFGAAFHRDAPARAFALFFNTNESSFRGADPSWHGPEFHRDCDRVFTCLTPRVLVDVPKTDREFASDPERLWRQPNHVESTQRILDLARKVRDGNP